MSGSLSAPKCAGYFYSAVAERNTQNTRPSTTVWRFMLNGLVKGAQKGITAIRLVNVQGQAAVETVTNGVVTIAKTLKNPGSEEAQAQAEKTALSATILVRSTIAQISNLIGPKI